MIPEIGLRFDLIAMIILLITENLVKIQIDTVITTCKVLCTYYTHPKTVRGHHLFNPLTSRVKPWVIQSFLTFDSMDRTLKCDHSLESC